MRREQIVLFGGVGLLIVFAIAGFVYKQRQAAEIVAVTSVRSSPLEREYSVGMGPVQARVVLVEFFDPACETCRVFSGHVKNILDAHPDRVRLVLRYAPFHQGSDTMVKILEAARLQGRFWETLDVMYATQPQWASHHHPEPDKIWQFLPLAGVDVARIREDMQGARVQEILAQDIADATTLDVRKTPQFFVNGKPLTSFGVRQLNALVESEIAAKYDGD